MIAPLLDSLPTEMLAFKCGYLLNSFYHVLGKNSCDQVDQLVYSGTSCHRGYLFHGALQSSFSPHYNDGAPQKWQSLACPTKATYTAHSARSHHNLEALHSIVLPSFFTVLIAGKALDAHDGQALTHTPGNTPLHSLVWNPSTPASAQASRSTLRT
jgi:hypothetical protein